MKIILLFLVFCFFIFGCSGNDTPVVNNPPTTTSISIPPKQVEISPGYLPIEKIVAVSRGEEVFIRTAGEENKIGDIRGRFLEVISDDIGALIMIESEDEYLVRAGGIIAGMSGSPVLIDDPTTTKVDYKVAGALAYAYTWTKNPPYIAFATPIEEMLKLSNLKEKLLQNRKFHLTSPIIQNGKKLYEVVPQPITLPFLYTGLTPNRMEMSSREFGFDGLFIKSDKGKVNATNLEPGSPIGISLVSGDYFNFSAIGTMAYKDGNNIFALGHPFLHQGDIEIPFAFASIYSIVSRIYRPFKLGAVSPDISGIFTQDRQAGLSGTIGLLPQRLFSFDVEFPQKGISAKHKIAPVEYYTPYLSSNVALSSVDTIRDRISPGMLNYSYTITLKSGGETKEVTWQDVISSDDPSFGLSQHIYDVTKKITTSRYVKADISSILLTIQNIKNIREDAEIKEVTFQSQPQPGTQATVSITISPYQQSSRIIESTLQIPQNISGKHTITATSECPQESTTSNNTQLDKLIGEIKNIPLNCDICIYLKDTNGNTKAEKKIITDYHLFGSASKNISF